MIDYEEELKKFEPCLDVADAEGAIYEREPVSYTHLTLPTNSRV